MSFTRKKVIEPLNYVLKAPFKLENNMLSLLKAKNINNVDDFLSLTENNLDNVKIE